MSSWTNNEAIPGRKGVRPQYQAEAMANELAALIDGAIQDGRDSEMWREAKLTEQSEDFTTLTIELHGQKFLITIKPA
jgi:hypothetical protein